LLQAHRVGGKLAGPIWLEGYGIFGNMHNFIRMDGLLIYNTMDRLSLLAGLKAIVPINSHISLALDYSRLWHQSSFTPASFSEENQNIKNYYSNSITGGITWKF
jgi:hypothetical protein